MAQQKIREIADLYNKPTKEIKQKLKYMKRIAQDVSFLELLNNLQSADLDTNKALNYHYSNKKKNKNKNILYSHKQDSIRKTSIPLYPNTHSINNNTNSSILSTSIFTTNLNSPISMSPLSSISPISQVARSKRKRKRVTTNIIKRRSRRLRNQREKSIRSDDDTQPPPKKKIKKSKNNNRDIIFEINQFVNESVQHYTNLLQKCCDSRDRYNKKRIDIIDDINNISNHLNDINLNNFDELCQSLEQNIDEFIFGDNHNKAKSDAPIINLIDDDDNTNIDETNIDKTPHNRRNKKYKQRNNNNNNSKNLNYESDNNNNDNGHILHMNNNNNNNNLRSSARLAKRNENNNSSSCSSTRISNRNNNNNKSVFLNNTNDQKDVFEMFYKLIKNIIKNNKQQDKITIPELLKVYNEIYDTASNASQRNELQYILSVINDWEDNDWFVVCEQTIYFTRMG